MNIESPVARTLMILAAFVVVVAGMKAAESILVPFLLSLFIAVVATPPLLWMQKRGIPSGIAMGLIVLFIIIGGILVGAIVGSSINGFRENLPEYQQKLSFLTSSVFAKLSSLGIAADPQQFKESFNPSSALALAGNTLAQMGNMMTNITLILLVVVFILAEETVFSEKLRFISGDSQKTRDAVRRFTSGVNQYVAIKTTMSFVTGLVIMLWVWVLGVDYFVLWGLLAFLLNYIPTLGSILAAVPTVLLAMVQLSPSHAGLVAAGYVAVNFVIGNILEPRMMGKGLDLSPLVVLLSLIFWGWVLGPIGMLLSIPLTMTMKIAFESFEDTQWIGVMLGSGKQLSEAVPEWQDVVKTLPATDKD